MAPRALATADVTGASYDNVVCGGGWGRHTNLLSHKQHFRWKKKSPFTSLMDGVLIIIMTFILFLINSFSADSSFSVVCRIRGSRSISAFIFYFYFGQFSYDCFKFFFISIWCYVSFLLSCIIYFFSAYFWEGQQGLTRVFQAHFSCRVSGDFMFKNYVLYVNGWLVLKIF